MTSMVKLHNARRAPGFTLSFLVVRVFSTSWSKPRSSGAPVSSSSRSVSLRRRTNFSNRDESFIGHSFERLPVRNFISALLPRDNRTKCRFANSTVGSRMGRVRQPPSRASLGETEIMLSDRTAKGGRDRKRSSRSCCWMVAEIEIVGTLLCDNGVRMVVGDMHV